MIQVESAHIPIAAGTHPGMTGKNNEDRYKVTAYHLEDHHEIPVLLAILSDGIGGHQAGEIAAQMAVDMITARIAGSNGRNPGQTMQEAVVEANNEIYQQATSESNRRGMGATVSIAWIIGNSLFTGTIGDSRIYLMRGGAIQQVSTDHTWIQEALERGVLTKDQVKGHPNAHVIRRYLGAPTPPEVDTRLRLRPEENNIQALANQGTPLRAGDRLLLCSDGLSDLVEAPEILAAFDGRTMDKAVQYLIDLANQRGGHDNITIVVIEMTASLAARRRLPWRLVVIILAVLLVLSVVAGVLVWMYLQFPTGGMGATPTSAPQPTISQPTIPPTLPPLPPPTATPSPTVTLTPLPPTPTVLTPAMDTLPAAGAATVGTEIATITPFPNQSLPTISAPGTPIQILATDVRTTSTPTRTLTKQNIMSLTPLPTTITTITSIP